MNAWRLYLFCLVVANPASVAACIHEPLADDCGGCYMAGWIRWETFVPACLLIAMAGCASILILERLIWFTVARRQSRAFWAKISSALYDNRLCEAVALPSLYPKSPLAAVVHISLDSRPHNDGHLRVEPSMEAWNRALALKAVEAKRRLWALAAIGRAAPLAGAFYACAQFRDVALTWRATEALYVSAYAGELALGAYAVMIGLCIAAPAIWMQKYFAWRSEILVTEMERLSLAILSQLARRSATQGADGLRGRYATTELPSPTTRRLGD
jgi:biopolymer transport protein ExbB/biopolymer transport protein TolQ